MLYQLDLGSDPEDGKKALLDHFDECPLLFHLVEKDRFGDFDLNFEGIHGTDAIDHELVVRCAPLDLEQDLLDLRRERR